MSPRGNRSNEKGFTMVEILVVMFILALLLIPIFKIMVLSYNTVQEEKMDSTERDDFRFFSTYLIEDLLFAQSVHVLNEAEQDVLSYTTKSGKLEQVYFHETKGILTEQNGKMEKVAAGERFEEGLPMVRIEKDGLIRFNVYSRELNILFVTSIKPRLNGGNN